MWQENTKELTDHYVFPGIWVFFQKQSLSFYFLRWGLALSLTMEKGKKVKSKLHSFMTFLLSWIDYPCWTLEAYHLSSTILFFFFNHLIPKTRRWETTPTACLSLQHISSPKCLSQQDSLAFRRWMDTLVQQTYFLLAWAASLILRQVGVWCSMVTASLSVLARY